MFIIFPLCLLLKRILLSPLQFSPVVHSLSIFLSLPANSWLLRYRARVIAEREKPSSLCRVKGFPWEGPKPDVSKRERKDSPEDEF